MLDLADLIVAVKRATVRVEIYPPEGSRLAPMTWYCEEVTK